MICAHAYTCRKNGVVKEAIEEEEEEEEEEDFGRLVTFWFGTFAMLFSATGCVFRHEST